MLRSITASTSKVLLSTITTSTPLRSCSLSPLPFPSTSSAVYYYRHHSTSTTTTSTTTSSTSTLPPLIAVETPVPTTLTDAVSNKREKVSRLIKARKAAITLTPTAITHLSALLDSPTPRLVRIGVRNKGCAGMSYHLDYVEKPERFDEVVEQGGVKVVVDSKALFSVIGSEMDWKEDELGAKFVFNNPNSVDTCGCGESFTV